MVLSAAYRYKDSIIQIYKGKENMPICNRHRGLPPGGRLEDFKDSKLFRVSKVSKVPKVFKAVADEASLGPKKGEWGRYLTASPHSGLLNW